MKSKRKKLMKIILYIMKRLQIRVIDVLNLRIKKEKKIVDNEVHTWSLYLKCDEVQTKLKKKERTKNGFNYE